MSLVPYPSDYVTPAQVVYGHLSGDGSSRNTAIHAAYQIQGVAFNTVFPDTGAARSVSAERCKSVTREEGVSALRALSGDHSMGVGAFDLKTVLKLVLPFVTQLLKEWVMTGDGDEAAPVPPAA